MKGKTMKKNVILKKLYTKKYVSIMLILTLLFSGCSKNPKVIDSDKSDASGNSSSKVMETDEVIDSNKGNENDNSLNQEIDSNQSDKGVDLFNQETDSLQSNVGRSTFNQVMETDIGYYYNSFNWGGMPLSLHYLDKETNKNIYLCVKPECQHDGSSFCPATNSKIKVFNTVLYGDYLYITGTENNTTISIYRAKINGTELTKLVDIVKLSNNSTPFFIVEECLIHRGKIYLLYRISDQAAYFGISSIITVDLTTLKSEVIEEINLIDKYVMANMKASGDNVYYMYVKNGSNMSSIKCYNTVDKTLETVPLPYKEGNYTNLYIYGYVIIGDEIWISCKTRENEMDIERNYISYDLVSGEIKNTLNPIREISRTDVEKSFAIESYNFSNSQIMYDGKYIYTTEHYWLNGVYKFESFVMTIFDLNGIQLAEFSIELLESDKFFYMLNILNDKIYIQTTSELKSCLVQDVINGSYAWTTEFEFTGVY